MIRYAKLTTPQDFVWSLAGKHGLYTDDTWVVVPAGEIVSIEYEGGLDIATWTRLPYFKRRADSVGRLVDLSPLEQLAMQAGT